MQAKNLISDIFPSIYINETGKQAISKMDIFKVSHIPLINNGNEYFGLLSENEIFDFDLMEKSFETYKKVLIRPFVYENQHAFDIIKILSKLNVSVVPVLNRNEKYVGAVCIHDIINYIGRITSSENTGTVFVLKMSIQDYSLSQISQIIEGNNAKILNLYTTTYKDSTRLDVTIKINLNDFSAIEQTFERYNYKITYSNSGSTELDELLEERYEEFMNYLNV